MNSPYYPKDDNAALFQRAMTGAPTGVEYRVNTDFTKSGYKWFDGYNAKTGNVIDTKHYVNWPKEDLKFSMDGTRDEMIQTNVIAKELGVRVEIPVATYSKSVLLQRIVTNRGLDNIIIIPPKVSSNK